MGTSEQSGVVLLDSSAFFSEAVDQAWGERNMAPSPHLKVYIIDLLKYFLKSDNLWSDKGSDGRRTREMLAVSLLKAQTMPPKIKIKTLKSLGDHSLYMSGLFPDFFQRKIIDVDYYVDMGKTAFSNLSDIVGEDTFSHLYSDISKAFEQLVDLLGTISQKVSLSSEENLLRLFDLYEKTNSPRVGEVIASKGFFPEVSAAGLKKKQ